MDQLIGGTLGLLFFGLITLLALLIGRELVCWYWKVNAALERLARLQVVLENIDRNLMHLGRVVSSPPPQVHDGQDAA